MNLPPELQWSPGEASTVNDFLNSPLGQKWLNLLFSRKPAIKMDTTEQAAMTGVFAAGYEAVFTQIHASRQVYLGDSASMKPIDPTRD